MNSPEFMIGTNRVVIKTMDGNKIIITREYIDDTLNYMVSFTGDISYILTDVAKECGYIFMLHGISIDDDIVTLEGTLMENFALKETYHIVNDNEFGNFIESYIPYPEETTRLIPRTLCFDEIKEMTGDLDMIQDMVDENILSASTRDLIDFGITIKPQLTVVGKSDKKENIDEQINRDVTPPLLTIINGRKDKVLKKR